ncbi:hypothetical protein NDU88_007417 [Pleurodeles waltl]|uniref:Uncharacterized protein n=1 Tax=Pleurodeles waltl TaxID=8319 RepID=A0AAV7QKN0_PLEWA|nr:hypothetical protein NDU88_007417 [Pleurodeles waltl]
MASSLRLDLETAARRPGSVDIFVISAGYPADHVVEMTANRQPPEQKQGWKMAVVAVSVVRVGGEVKAADGSEDSKGSKTI